MRSGIYKFDPKAEWHKLDSVLVENGGQVLCQVCGEVYDYAYFQMGCVVKCEDCGLNLEMVVDCTGEYIVIWQDNDVKEDLAKKFYDRLKGK